MKGIQNTSTENFSTIIGNNKYFIVPKFQRDYSWDKEQWDDLWQDLLDMRAGDDEHYMGYLVLQTKDDKEYRIIDGQQRFTTITLIILAAIKAIQKLVEKGVEEEDNKKRAEHFMHTFVGKEDPVTLVYDNILRLNRNNDGYYRDYIVPLRDLPVRGLNNSERLMRNAFEHYEKKMQLMNASGKEYAELIQDISEKLYFTTITVSDELNAFKVFETLNARGVQLSSSDLLKNYLFSLVDDRTNHNSHIELLEEKWSKLTYNIKAEKLPEFLRYYWNVSHRSIRANALFKTIQKEIKNDREVFALLADLQRYSDVYMALMQKNDELWEDDEVKNCVGLLNLFRLKQPYSLLMAAKLNLSAQEFKKLFKVVLAICFRYNVICDKNPNDQEIPFNNLAIYICDNKSLDLSLLDKLYVSDDEFERSFADKSFSYNSNNAKIIRYILGQIEKGKGNREVRFDEEEASIEHILPQHYDEKWCVEEDVASRVVNRLGNMCLLEKKKNTDLQDAPFSEKVKTYAQSVYWSAKEVAENYGEWDDGTIIKRQKNIARLAKSLWKWQH